MEASTFSYTQFLTVGSLSSYSSGSNSLQFMRFEFDKKALKFKPSSIFSVRASTGGARDSVVTLLDYGAGNVRSVRNAIRRLGFDIKDVTFLDYGAGNVRSVRNVISRLGFDIKDVHNETSERMKERVPESPAPPVEARTENLGFEFESLFIELEPHELWRIGTGRVGR